MRNLSWEWEGNILQNILIVSSPTGECYSWVHHLKTSLNCLYFRIHCWHSICLIEEKKKGAITAALKAVAIFTVSRNTKTKQQTWFDLNQHNKTTPLNKYLLGNQSVKSRRQYQEGNVEGAKRFDKWGCLKWFLQRSEIGFLIFFLPWLATSLLQVVKISISVSLNFLFLSLILYWDPVNGNQNSDIKWLPEGN